MNKLMSLEEAALYLFGSGTRGAHRRVGRLIQAGAIRALRDGRRWWVVRSSLSEVAA